MIFKLKPAIKDYIWGGTRLRDEYGKKSDTERLAESWELSCHSDGLSTIDGGRYDGMKLSDYLAEHPEALGENCSKYDKFPVLIKLIDAKEDLSIQVHPNDKYASKYENDSGKTEVWFIVDCEPGASIIYGFKNQITKSEFKDAVKNNTLLDMLNVVPVKKGDAFLIKAGTIHAIGKGILIAEIQQNSNTTYRVYDYGRTDKYGNTRELHINKALDVMKLGPVRESKRKPDRFTVTENKYFKVYKLAVSGESKWRMFEKSFAHVLVLAGRGKILSSEFLKGSEVTDEHEFQKGGSFFIPAGVSWKITGKCSLIFTVI